VLRTGRGTPLRPEHAGRAFSAFAHDARIVAHPHLLRRSLGKDTDGPVSRWLNRPLSTRLSMALAPLRPAPDLISLVAFALGLAGAALLSSGRGLLGALLVHAASVTDGVDGEVARLQLRGGPRGALLDAPAAALAAVSATSALSLSVRVAFLRR
jgi:hypothetical protein